MESEIRAPESAAVLIATLVILVEALAPILIPVELAAARARMPEFDTTFLKSLYIIPFPTKLHSEITGHASEAIVKFLEKFLRLALAFAPNCLVAPVLETFEHVFLTAFVTEPMMIFMNFVFVSKYNNTCSGIFKVMCPKFK